MNFKNERYEPPTMMALPIWLRNADGGGAVQLHIIERREGRNHGNSKSLLPGDEIVREHPPGALRVADAYGAGKPIDGYGKLHAIFENFVSQRSRQLDASGAAVMASRAVGDIGPAFQEDTAMPALLQSRMTQHLVG